MNAEQRRIIDNISNEYPLGVRLEFKISCNDPAPRLKRIKDLMFVIASKRADEWPDEEMWSRILPQWFVQKIKSYTVDELYQSPNLLWHYGSWIDALRFRGWEWFSSFRGDDFFSIQLEALAFPYSVNPLEYVIYETGVPIDNISFKEY